MHLHDVSLPLETVFADPLSDEAWTALRSHLDVYAPRLIEAAEQQLARPDGPSLDPNAGLHTALGVGLGLVFLARREPLPERYDVFLRIAVEYPPEDGDNVVGHAHLAAYLTEILRALPMARRASVVVQDRFDKTLCWSLARRAEVRTPAVAARAAWKLADLGNRRNGGGTYDLPTLRPEELALFETLGVMAVPAIEGELAGARRVEFLVRALGRSRCAEALVPLASMIAGGAATHKLMARDAAAEVIRAIGEPAALDALGAMLVDANKKRRAGAAAALGLVSDSPARRALLESALATERDASVRAALDGLLHAPPLPVALARWRALHAAWEARCDEAFKTARTTAGHGWCAEFLRLAEAWPDEAVGVAAVVAFHRYAQEAPRFYDGERLAPEVAATRALSGELLALLPWGLLDLIDQYKRAYHVDAAVRQSVAWIGRPPREAMRYALSREPLLREALYAQLARATPYEDADLDAFVTGLGDASAKVRRLCRDALVTDPARATPRLRDALAGEKRAKRRAALEESLALCGAAPREAT